MLLCIRKKRGKKKVVCIGLPYCHHVCTFYTISIWNFPHFFGGASRNTTFRTIEPIVIGKLITESLIGNRIDRKMMSILLKM